MYQGYKEVGNSITPTSVHGTKMAAKNWCFTINNFSEDDRNNCSNLCTDHCNYAIYQIERGDNGTVHIQGYLELKTRKRLPQVKRILSERAHLEVARGSPDQNRSYCTKPESRIEGPFEHGTISKGKGKRSDIEAFVEAATQDLTEEQLISEHASVLAKYPRFVERVRKHQKEKAVQPRCFTPRPGWQSELVDYIAQDPDTRKIRWYTDTIGNTGKSTFAHGVGGDVYVVTGGKHADILYAYNYERVVIFDLSREMEERVPYGVMETFKNGYFLSTKYEVKRVRFNIPHVIVFSNFSPDKTKLSNDRWDIHNINTI